MNDEHDIEEEGLEQEVVERRLDWALGEVVGDERAPDVVMAVMTRRAAALVESQQVRVTGRGGPLLNAAVLVLGLVVVAWVMFASRAVDEAGSPGGQDPEFVVVTTMAQLRELPADTRAVELRDLGNDGFVALAKQCPALERLRVRGRGPDSRAFVMIRDHIDEQAASMESKAATTWLGMLDAYPELMDLDVSGCATVDGAFVGYVVQSEALTSIAIGGTAADEGVIGFFELQPHLRRIDFGEAPWLTLAMVEKLMQRGERVLVRRPGDPQFERQVAELARRYGPSFERPFYRQVKTLEELQALPQSVAYIELSHLGDAATDLLIGRERLRGVAYDNANFKATGDSMRLLGAMQQLEELRITMQVAADIGIEQLGGLRGLRKLDLFGPFDVPMDWLGELGELRELRLAIPRLDAATMEAIARCTSLENLDLEIFVEAEDEVLERVAALRRLRRLHLPGQACGPRTIAAIARLTQLEHLDLRRVSTNPSGGEFPPMPSLRPLTRLLSLASLHLGFMVVATDDLLAMPPSLRELTLAGCRGLDPSVGPILRDRFPRLAVLTISQAEWLDDAALQAVLAAPSLESFVVQACKLPTAASVPALYEAKRLRYLDTSYSPFLEAAAAEALRRERPELELIRKVW